MKPQLLLACLLTMGFFQTQPLSAQRTPGVWEPKATMGSGRFWSFSFALDGKIYGGTGRPEFSSLSPLNDFWEYDPTTDTWSQKADYPGGKREGATAFVAEGRGFVAFGSPFIQFSKDMYEYLPATDQWVQRASVPGIGFAFSRGFVIDSMYYIGPENGTNQVYAYNVHTDSWTTVAPFPGNDRRAQVSFTLKGKGYIGMGAGVFGGVYGDFWSYDPVADAWTQVADIFPKSDQSTAFSIGDYGYVANAGGSGGGGKDTYRYEPELNQWFYEATMPGDRIANATSCALDSLGYLLFGERTTSGGNFSSDQIWVFSPGKDTTTHTAVEASDPKGSIYLWEEQDVISLEARHIQTPQTAFVSLLDIHGKSWLSQEWDMLGPLQWNAAQLSEGLYLIRISVPEQGEKTLKYLRR